MIALSKLQCWTKLQRLFLAVVVAGVAVSTETQVQGFVLPSSSSSRVFHWQARQAFWSRAATVEKSEATDESTTTDDAASQERATRVLQHMASSVTAAKDYAEAFGFSHTEAALHAMFSAISKCHNDKNDNDDFVLPLLGLNGHPFVLRRDEIESVMATDGAEKTSPFRHFYTLKDFQKAVNEDFLDASRGSTDNRKGWKITNVSVPRGESFEDARMTFDDVLASLEKGTVILNAAGAHIPKLAPPSLACSDAMALPNAINLYITAAGKRTSAPPHTDRQDVLVVQTSGRKHWKVFAPPEPSRKPTADIFARGKMDDNLALYTLEQESPLLIETVLEEGDILFVPAAFPHTTSTVHSTTGAPANQDDEDDDQTSVHLTFNIDTHIWSLDYLSARRLALQRAGVHDTALEQTLDADNRYEGKINQLPTSQRNDLLEALPVGSFLSEEEEDKSNSVNKVVATLKAISHDVDEKTAAAVLPDEVWTETVQRLRQQGMEILETHRDMYLAAIQEGRTREAENSMTAHLDSNSYQMTPERMQRLSVFRVRKFYDQINESIAQLSIWSRSGSVDDDTGAGAEMSESVEESSSSISLPPDWRSTMPVNVGDQVEADLGGAFFTATVTRVAPGGDAYDVQFFDGDSEKGLPRSMIKLLTPPAHEDDADEAAAVDTSKMTAKQLKRWKKQQQKNNK